MAENIKEYDDEIDLLSLLLTIWEGKWKILSIMAVSLLSVFGFNTVLPNTTFNAQTEIKPITSFEFDKYRLFNASLRRFNKDNVEVQIFNISKESLLALYIEQIDEGTLLEIGIDKFELIDKDEFDNDKDYREAIQKFASEIEVLRPINGDEKTKVQTEVDLSKIIVEMDDDHTNQIGLTDNVSVIMRYPTVKTFQGMDLAKFTADDTIALTANCIHQIVDGVETYEAKDLSKKEINDFLENLTQAQFTAIQKFFASMPKLTHEVKLTHPKTKKKGTVKLQGLRSFF